LDNYIPIQVISEFIYLHCQGVKTSKNGSHFHARCPLCGDSQKSLSKKRFHLDYNNGNPGYHCFNCGRHGSFIDLYSELKGISPFKARQEIIKFSDIPSILAKKLSQRKPKEKEIINMNYILNDCIKYYASIDGYIQTQYQRHLRHL